MLSPFVKKTDFVNIVDAAINYFDPEAVVTEEERKYLEIANETIKIEIDRLKRSINEIQENIKKLELNNTVLSGNLAFTLHEISELETDNIIKQNRIQDLKDTIEARKKYLEEAQLELDTHRRKEAFFEIAEKRMNVGGSVWSKPVYSNDIKSKAEEKEKKLEEAITKIQKLREDIRRSQETINAQKFRIEISSGEFKQIMKPGSEESYKVQTLSMKRPTTALVKNRMPNK